MVVADVQESSLVSGHTQGQHSHTREQKSKSGFVSAVFNYTNSIIGAGIIGMPLAFSQAGIWWGLILLSAVAYLTDYGVRVLVQLGEDMGCLSYQDVCQKSMGRVGLVLSSVCMFTLAFGGCLAYSVIIGDTVSAVIQAYVPDEFQASFFVSRHFVILVCSFCIMLPLCLFRDISKLARTSIISITAVMIILAIIVVEGVIYTVQAPAIPADALVFARPNFFQAIGTFAFAFVCQHNSFFIYQSLERRNPRQWSLIAHASIGLSLIVCVLLAIAGVTTFWHDTVGDVLNNFPFDDHVMNVARLFFALTMFFTYPLENYVAREVVEALFFSRRPESTVRRVVISTLLVVVTTGISEATDNLGIVLDLTGGFSAVSLAFILPPIAYLIFHKRTPLFAREKWPMHIILVIGVVVMLMTTGTTVYDAVIKAQGLE